jgi:hypothetical protein
MPAEVLARPVPRAPSWQPEAPEWDERQAAEQANSWIPDTEPDPIVP